MTDIVIRTKQLTRQFGKTLAVNRLDLDVPRGSVFGFIGRNGAGKTTTIRMLLNLLPMTSGFASVLGLDPRKQSVEIKRRVGYVPEQHHFYRWMRVEEAVRFTSSFYPKNGSYRWVARAACHGVALAKTGLARDSWARCPCHTSPTG